MCNFIIMVWGTCMITLKQRFKHLKFNGLTFVTSVLFIILMALLIRRQLELRFLVEWGDESETIVVTKMMAAGYRLYSEVYNNHGPLVFLPGFMISRMGNYGIATYRWIPIVLQWLTLISIYLSPLFKNHLQRIFATSLSGVIIVLFMPLFYGHTYLYQTMSGLFMIIIFSQYALPVLTDKPLNFINIMIGNLLVFSLPFLAVTNLPFAILIFVISLRLKNVKAIVSGAIIALIINFGFLLVYGSWDGYIAYHYYLNSTVLYSGKGIEAFIKTILDFYSKNLTHFITLLIILLATMKLSLKGSWIHHLANLMLIPMFISLVIRGGLVLTLSGLIYLYALVGLSLVFFDVEFIESDQIKQFVQLLPLYGVLLVSIYIFYLPQQADNYYYEFLPETEFSRIVTRITEPDEKILALSFRSYEYLVADRLPASTHFIYLSIQAKYNQKPYKDIYVSIVDDVKKNRPKAMIIDEWNIIIDESDHWSNYAADLMEYVNEEYYRLEGSQIYIRKDVNLLDYGLDPYYGYEIEQ